MPSRIVTRVEAHIIEETIEVDTEREEQLDVREQELDDRQSDYSFLVSELEDQENEHHQRQRQLARSVSTWTGIPIPVNQPIDQYLGSFDWSVMPVPEGFVNHGQAFEPATPYQGEDVDDGNMSEPDIRGSDISDNEAGPHEMEDPFVDEPLAAPTPAARSRMYGVPNFQQRLRTQSAKRKRSEPEVVEVDGPTQSNKKANMVIDLTGED